MTTNYKTAVNWCNNSLILCNNIVNIDASVYDNVRFNFFDENDDPVEIYQYFITDCDIEEVEFLEKHFNLLFTFSDLLDCYILCVDHYGTNWGSVPCETDLPQAVKNMGE